MKENYRLETISDALEKNYMPYAMSVIVSRAIPEIDGFKPSHRKLLYTMYKMGLLSGARTKSANVVGQTMRLNPHGDAAIYETMVRLTKGNESLLHPYIDSKGNFGKQYSRDMQYAASRYTEVKLDKICGELFRAIDKNVIEMRDNYDGTMKEPALLPVSFPSILVNANQGIAVGMASNICPFNLAEVCQATISYIKDSSFEILDVLEAPDFPGGGTLIYNREAMRQIYETGRGSFKLRAKYKYDKKENRIEILEIPYTTNLEVIIDDISDLIKSGKIKEISDVRDETDLGGLKLSIDLKKGIDAELLMQKLYKLTTLESTYSCNFNLLVDNKAVVLGIKDILKNWLKFRKTCYQQELLFDLNKLKDKYHLLLALEKIILDLDEAINIIRNTPKESEVVARLQQHFAIDEVQANYVADIKLRHLNQEYLLLRLAERQEVLKEIQNLENILNSPQKINTALIKQLQKIKDEYGQARKTTILVESEVQDFKKEMFIEDYNLKIFVTDQGYLKKIPLTSLRSNPEIKLKDDDRIVRIFETTNRSEILVFSNLANCYKLQLPEISDCKPSEWGTFLPVLCGMASDEKVVFVLPLVSYVGHLLFAYENGKMSKIPLSAYETKTKRKKLIGAFSDKEKIVSILYLPPLLSKENTDSQVEQVNKLKNQDYLDKNDQIILAITSKQKIIAFSPALISEKTTRSSQGIIVLNLRGKSTLKSVFSLADLLNLGEDRDSIYKKFFFKDGNQMSQADILEVIKKYEIKKIPSAGFSCTYLGSDNKQLVIKM